MGVATFLQTIWTGAGAQTPTVYKGAIDGDVSVLARLAAAFAPHEQSTPNMTVRLDAGPLFDGTTLTEVAAQSTGAIVAPVGNPRIDRVVINSTSGAVSVITGTPAASPVAPAVTAGNSPVAQVLLQTSSATITNSMITDERVLDSLGLAAALVKQTHTALLTAGTAPNFTATPAPALTAYAANQRFRIKFHAAGAGSDQLNFNTLGNKALKKYDGSGAKVAFTPVANLLADVEYDGTDMVVLNPPASSSILRNYLSGCLLAPTAASTTMPIGAGQATDSTNAVTMSIAALSKTTAAWAVGTAQGGKLSAAAIANNTWYYFYAIRRPDTGVTDYGFDVSSSAPTMPTNYTQFRYIGAAQTNGSAQWQKSIYHDNGDVQMDTEVLDVNTAGVVAGALAVCTVPLGRKVLAKFNCHRAIAGSVTDSVRLSDPDTADIAPSTTATPLGSHGIVTSGGTALAVTWQQECWTNTSGQIRHRALTTATVMLALRGYVDTRGRDA